MSMEILVNGNRRVNAALNTRLLWVVREELKLTGTKFGCRAGLCGACMVREKIAMPTCHDATFAHKFDQAGVDVLLVITIAENGKPIRSRWCQSGFGTTG